MNRFFWVFFLFSLIPITGWAEAYQPDTLRNNYFSRTFIMPDDYEGKTICTLVKKKTTDTFRKAILYVHGYNDYFFQTALGDSMNVYGYNFYALDLRKYGRSLLPHQDAFYCKNLNEYFSDLDTAIATILSEGNIHLILMGHSTGGLITALYLDKRQPSDVHGLILNSPFLDMNMNWFMEKIMVPLGSLWGAFFPRIPVKQDNPAHYTQSLRKEYHGEWSFNTTWKKPGGHPQRLGWVRAIHKGHKKVRKGLSIPCPVLVMSSGSSIRPAKEWNDNYKYADIVLDIKDIQHYGAKLGPDVSVCVIPDGIHDLVLSQEPARTLTYHTIFQWLNKGL